MKRLITYIAFLSLTGLTSTNTLSVIAGGCSTHINRKVEIHCSESDTECQDEKPSNLDLKELPKS